jgi:hypothetical protein
METRLSGTKSIAPLQFLGIVAVLAVVTSLWTHSPVLAQGEAAPAPGTSRGENFSAKPPAALFASDCTGSDCHKSPQGLAKTHRAGGLANFLRAHYTNSRESAAALAGYLTGLPSGPEPKETRPPRPVGTGTSANAPAETLQRQNPNTRPQRARQPATAAAPPSPEPPVSPPPPPQDSPVSSSDLPYLPVENPGPPPAPAPASASPVQFDIFD